MILTPFKWIVALFFNWSNALFHDPGWAVVGMSVLLSLLLTPLYIWIERRKNSDKAKSAPMQAEIDKIEAVYSGRERFYYTREIQRRYKYSPWTAMIPTLGLLVQIPFLLAAYHYLSELPIFNGASFWYIKDLSKPDTIATFAGLPINLLAILMTVINLVSGWRYAESGKPKERIQYMAVAAVFLVLLYNCAASVVLYWTLSNALSLVRSEVFFRQKGAANNASSVHMENWFTGFCRIMIPNGMAICLFAVLYFLFSAILYPEADSYESYIVVKGLLRDSLIFAVVAECAAFFCISRLGARRTVRGWMLQWSVAVQVALFALLYLRDFTDCPIDASPVLLYFSERVVPLLLIFSGIVLVQLLYYIPIPDGCGTETRRHISGGWNGTVLLSLCYLFFTLFVWHPLLVFCSDADSFSVPIRTLFGNGLLMSALLIAGIYAVWLLLCSRIMPLPAVFLVVYLSCVVFMYLFVLPMSCGTLQGAELIGAENLVRPHRDFIVEFALLSLLALGVSWCVGKSKRKLMVSVLAVLNVICAIQAVSKMAKTVWLNSQSRGASADNKLVFSKNHRNVLILMLDMVQGWSFKCIADDPRLSEKLAGFTYYPNTLSVSTMTCPSIPVLYAGPEFSPYDFNKVSGKTIGQKGRECLAYMDDLVRKAGYEPAIFNPKLVYASDYNLKSPLYDNQRLAKVLGRDNPFARNSALSVLRGNALLQAVPLFLKPSIYNDGLWLNGDSGESDFLPFGDDHLFLEALPLLSESRETDKGSYIFLHAEVTHNPWGIPLDKVGFEEVDNKGMLIWTMDKVFALFDWMKRNGVYDNTRIFLVSDHGLVNLTKNRWIAAEDPFVHRELWSSLAANCGTLSGEWRIQSFNALLCAKDFDDIHPLRTDNRLAGNEDIVPMALSERISDVTDKFPSTRRAYLVAPVGGHPFQPLEKFPIGAIFDVKDNIFDLRNWTRVGGGM